MIGGFIAFRCSNFDNTAEREQYRFLCNVLREKYKNTEELCLLIANYNLYDSEFDSILIKNDAICAIEFKNYGGKIIAQENGNWTSNGKIIGGGSRKTVYQQARINHAALKNGLKNLGLKAECIKDIPSIIVFNEDAIIENKLSGKVKSWLHITDNFHFLEKVEDITCKSTNLSNLDIINIAIKMNLNNFLVQDLSLYQNNDTRNKVLSKTLDLNESLQSYDRLTPNHIYSLRPNQIFVFGTDKWGTQKYGAAGLTSRRFGAQMGISEGPTGMCYALPTKGFSETELSLAVERFEQYVKSNTQYTFLVTAIGCGHAGLNVEIVANMFKGMIPFANVMLPPQFIDVYREESLKSKQK